MIASLQKKLARNKQQKESLLQTDGFANPLLSSDFLPVGDYAAAEAMLRKPPSYAESVHKADFSVEPLSIQATFAELSDPGKRSMKMQRRSVEPCVERVVIYKAHESVRLGLSLDAEYKHHSLIASTTPDSLSAKVFDEGDLILRVDGALCTEPAECARMLREASGNIELHIMRRADVDFDAVIAAERPRGE